MSTSVVIATHGAPEWEELAWSRAHPSAMETGAHEVIVHHKTGGTLAEARNEAVSAATGDWLCFLDADDELDPRYLHAMADQKRYAETVYEPAVARAGVETDGRWLTRLPLALLAPSVSYVRSGVASRPEIPNAGKWPATNECVIGTLVPRYLFEGVGGFREFDCYEDWDLWLRCAKAGATIVHVPQAVYVAHVRDGARNHTNGPVAYEQIWRDYNGT